MKANAIAKLAMPLVLAAGLGMGCAAAGQTPLTQAFAPTQAIAATATSNASLQGATHTDGEFSSETQLAKSSYSSSKWKSSYNKRTHTYSASDNKGNSVKVYSDGSFKISDGHGFVYKSNSKGTKVKYSYNHGKTWSSL